MLLKKASLFLGNDSGPAHLAGGVGTPSIIISPWPLSVKEEGATSPMRSRPVGPCVKVVQPLEARPPCNVPCIGEEAHCILGVTAEEIVKHASSLLERKGMASLHEHSREHDFEIGFKNT